MRAHSIAPGAVLQISVGRDVSSGDADYARDKIGRALAAAPEPVLSARVRLTRHRDPAVTEPALAQANVNMEGRPVRVQVTAATIREAIDLLEARLLGRFERTARNWEALRGRGPAPHEWRHGMPPRTPLPYFPRPVEQREVVRRKSYALAGETCDEAAFDMDTMDYDFFLFTESGSGIDSVLYRGGGEYRLAQLDPRPEAVTPGSVPVTISAAPAPVATVDGAVERLEVTGWPFVFFHDSERHRGCVLYHRYDGHYGLLTPAT